MTKGRSKRNSGSSFIPFSKFVIITVDTIGFVMRLARFYSILILLLTITTSAFGWGRVGHFITGDIATAHLNEQAKERVQEILGDMTMREATVWMDEVRRTDEFRHTASWHWVTIPDGETYDEAEKNPSGDIVEALERKIAKLKAGGMSAEDERVTLLMVIHMIGDIHQPLHVGTGEDRGGNDVRVTYMDRNTNLHALWDTGMIVSWGLEPDVFASGIDRAPEELIKEWQTATVRDWAKESVSYRPYVYDLPEDKVLGWEYRNRHFHIVEKRLYKSGVRIAGLLNEIYG